METVKLSSEFMDDFYRKHPEYKDVEYDWCECEQETDDFIFHDDNIAPWDSCVLKHHYHCGLCLKLNQIG